MTQQELIQEMKLCRDYCSLIHKARNSAGFSQLKYPITDVKINHYFTKEFRQLIADECNIVGYMDIPPVEDVFNYGIPNGQYQYLKDGELEVWVSTVKSDWQDELFHKRLEKRNEAEMRKKLSTTN